jgi:hypothetical protein
VPLPFAPTRCWPGCAAGKRTCAAATSTRRRATFERPLPWTPPLPARLESLADVLYAQERFRRAGRDLRRTAEAR